VFFPLFWKFTGAAHAKIGYLNDRTEGDPDIDWERFYLGGINSIRGFSQYDINNTPEGSTILRGGDKSFQFNFELIFPIQEDAGVAGVIFYDRGDVYGETQNIDLLDQYSTTGFELRWNSPMGPIRLAYGIVLEGAAGGNFMKETGDGQFDFSIGAFF
jgi:outer membrane protein insertion porin family